MNKPDLRRSPSSRSPEQIRAVLEEGLRAQREGKLETAKEAYLRALAVAPDHPDALTLLGTAWLQLGDARQAASYLERAAQKLRNHPGVLGNLAQAYVALGRYDNAEDTFRKASRLDPRNVYFELGVANSIAMRGALGDAEIALRKLADRFPAEPLVWFNLGNALREQKQLQDALPCYVKALDLDPELVEAHNNLGQVLHALYRFDEAERKYRACIAMDPDYVTARYNLASVLIDVGRFLEAEATCREIIEREPASAVAQSFLGASLGHQGRWREAFEYTRRAAELAPQDSNVVAVHAAMLAEAGDLSRALRWFAHALALSPDPISEHQLLGNALLSQGCLADGWLEYGYRPAFNRFREKYTNIALSRTLPPELPGKDVLLMREQGVGDEIFFLRFAPLLSAAGARVTYRASDKIRSLLTRVSCLAQIMEETAPVPQADTIMMLGDLPHALSNYAASPFHATASDDEKLRGLGFPYHISVFWPSVPPSLLITPLTERLTAMQGRLAQAGKPPYLGLTWRAGIAPREQRAAWSLYKEIRIESFAQALNAFPGTLIAFQRNPEPGEIETFSRAVGKEVHDFSDLNENLEDMLATLALADEYIGVSNTNMHLRAAAGRTARVLVPCPAEWRWMAAGSSSPWFPEFSLYRQSHDGDWSAALARLHEDLKALYR